MGMQPQNFWGLLRAFCFFAKTQRPDTNVFYFISFIITNRFMVLCELETVASLTNEA